MGKLLNREEFQTEISSFAGQIRSAGVKSPNNPIGEWKNIKVLSEILMVELD